MSRIGRAITSAAMSAALVIGCATQPPRVRTSPRSDALAEAERVQIVEEVISSRYANIPDGAPADACSIFLLLGGDEQFASHLSSFARSKLGAGALAPCPPTLGHRRAVAGWYIRSITRTGAGEVTVTALLNGHGGHTETFILGHGYGDAVRWRVREMRLSGFWFE